MIREYGIEEYGNNEFTLTCNKCGRSAWITPTHYYNENGLDKITLELHCTCGNRYGATIHHETAIHNEDKKSIAEMKKDLLNYCQAHEWCENCKIDKLNSHHTCGCGASYNDDSISESEIELNYSIIKEE